MTGDQRWLVSTKGRFHSGTALHNITIFYAGQTVGSTVAGTDGGFQITGLRGGVHGVVASGPAGYAAFAFNAIEASEIAGERRVFKQTFFSALQSDEQMPVVLCPSQMTNSVIESENPGAHAPG